MDAPAAHPTVRSHIELMGSCENANPLPDAVVDFFVADVYRTPNGVQLNRI
jgi:hypothetical protein